jgi:hypothetical protein
MAALEFSLYAGVRFQGSGFRGSGGERTPVLSEDLSGKKILGAKTPRLSEEISGIQRIEALEFRSKLRIEAMIEAK